MLFEVLETTITSNYNVVFLFNMTWIKNGKAFGFGHSIVKKKKKKNESPSVFKIIFLSQINNLIFLSQLRTARTHSALPPMGYLRYLRPTYQSRI